MKKQKGFTLVEVLAVIVIVGILLTVAALMVQTIIMKSREDAFLATALSLQEASRKYSLYDQIDKEPVEKVFYAELVKEGLIEKIRDPFTGEFFSSENETYIILHNREPQSICLMGYSKMICGEESNRQPVLFDELARSTINPL